MGDGASKSANQAPTLEELRSLWEKHDSNGSGELERAEVFALLDDLRRRYGLSEPLPQEVAEGIFVEYDMERAGTWNWHDVRQLGGSSFGKLKKRLHRQRLRHAARHHGAGKGKDTWQKAFTDLVGQVTGAGASPAVPLPVTKPKAVETVELQLHALRAEGLIIPEDAWLFSPCVEVRVVRGDPRLGCTDQRDLAALEGPCVVHGEIAGDSNSTTTDPTWKETLPLRMELPSKRGIYVHVVICDKRLGVGLGPLADVVLTLDEVLDLQRRPKVSRFPLHPILPAHVGRGAALVAQWGGPRPHLKINCAVVRAENLPQETLLVEVAVHASGSGCVLARGRSEAAPGPNPRFLTDVPLECDDEGDMQLQCTVFCRRYGIAEEAVAELATRIPQAECAAIVDPLSGSVSRRPLRPLGQSSAGGQLTVAFGGSTSLQLAVRPRTATGLTQKEDAWSFDPFVQVILKSQDPRDGLGNVPIVTEGHTETLTHCTGDPHWKEPVLMEFVPEQGLFLHIVVCSERFARAPDELADVILPLSEVLQLYQQNAAERQYKLREIMPNRKHAAPVLFLSFGEGGGLAPRGAEQGTILIPRSPGAPAASGGLHRARAAVRFASTAETRSADADSFGRGIADAPTVGFVPTSQFGADLPRAAAPPDGQALQPIQGAPSALAPLPRGPIAVALPENTRVAIEEQQERAELQRLVQQRGGDLKGFVPLSFFRNPHNPHAVWLGRP